LESVKNRSKRKLETEHEAREHKDHRGDGVVLDINGKNKRAGEGEEPNKPPEGDKLIRKKMRRRVNVGCRGLSNRTAKAGEKKTVELL